jgi:hypothetical protein
VVPNTMKVPVPFDFAFPCGALFLGVEPATDFERRGTGDDQVRDKDTGQRVWVVKVMDLDPEAGKFGRSNEVKVKIPAPVQPIPPSPSVPGYPPSVEFVGLTVTPYADSTGCKGVRVPHKCRARQAWSLRAAEMVPAGSNTAVSDRAA